MPGAEWKGFDNPDETRKFDLGELRVINFTGTTVAKATFPPGWRWSEVVKPIVGTESCQQHHVGYVVSGTLEGTTDDGDKFSLTAGDAYVIHPGHDAWVAGTEEYVSLEFHSNTAETFGKPSS